MVIDVPSSFLYLYNGYKIIWRSLHTPNCMIHGVFSFGKIVPAVLLFISIKTQVYNFAQVFESQTIEQNLFSSAKYINSWSGHGGL